MAAQATRRRKTRRTVNAAKTPAAVPNLPKIQMNSLFSRLRALAKKTLGLTNAKLAEHFGVSRSVVSRWATGNEGRQPPLWAVAWLLDKLNRAIVMLSADRYLLIPKQAAEVLAGYDDIDLGMNSGGAARAQYDPYAGVSRRN